ncbi:putative cytokinetic ring protein SteA [Alkalihalobacillus oceani]|uniref:putative cytokinetic ring protein SteA n=1 Tax=Halalkalibacter oceani TaxID=1653776 RepID=UPI00203F9D13|nr:putative cytokinetic ring protein SteA [Halalkalibacter oceani]MCM3762766.1 putative cytokinetic ring protein SteA [Halalkalibacter oceani]
MAEIIKGPIYEHEKTKELLQYVPKQAIVFLWHEDLDGVAADSLVKANVKAVINGKPSMSGKYRQKHVMTLLAAGIVVFDVLWHEKRASPFNGEMAAIVGDELFTAADTRPVLAAKLLRYNQQMLEDKLEQADGHFSATFAGFVKNTLHYAERESDWFQSAFCLPGSLQSIKGKNVFIVARNTNYEKDLRVIRSKLLKKSSIVMAVDGAADGLLRQGVCPHFIIGDMDSVSGQALTCGAALLCHQHPDGHSPGKLRVEALGLQAETICFVGTSEDVAISAAFWAGAEHMYLIGCRIGMVEFLEKGRAGMGSTWLARIQAGEKITDLKGIHTLYDNPVRAFPNALQAKLQTYGRSLYHMLQERINEWKKKEALHHD